jgi:hypothetical protein
VLQCLSTSLGSATATADELTARRHAIGVIQELQKADEPNWHGFTMEVRRDGQLVGIIPFELVERSADQSR